MSFSRACWKASIKHRNNDTGSHAVLGQPGYANISPPGFNLQKGACDTLPDIYAGRELHSSDGHGISGGFADVLLRQGACPLLRAGSEESVSRLMPAHRVQQIEVEVIGSIA